MEGGIEQTKSSREICMIPHMDVESKLYGWEGCQLHGLDRQTRLAFDLLCLYSMLGIFHSFINQTNLFIYDRHVHLIHPLTFITYSQKCPIITPSPGLNVQTKILSNSGNDSSSPECA